ncbi:unnamed protein product [Peronospora farinosa]|uniref:Uncharacterized protein n=2 Tax=Peronospora farinosa TaxID=134698 RepID=A0ABN8CIF5_9STRA|nr:unnamed protein product [Peronospora farinosa]
MSGSAYFIGRKELLTWVNALCGTELTRVEQTCSGAVACQVLDAVYPGRISMSKVNWTASREHDIMRNYKLLQQSFTALKIDKQIPVDRLIRGRYQDNLEFLQWLKAFYDTQRTLPMVYDARSQRAKGKGGDQYMYNNKVGERHTSTPSMKKKARLDEQTPRRQTSQLYRHGETKSSEYTIVLEKMEHMKITSKGLLEEKEGLMMQIHELNEAIKRTKKERDFYMKKLEMIGELVHEGELSKTTSAQTNFLGLSILDVIYATEEDEQEQELLF